MNEDQPPVGPLTITSAEGYEVWSMGLAPVNAIGPDLLTALEAAVASAKANPEVAAIVLTSDLRVFSAGADATWMALTVAEVGAEGLLEIFQTTMNRFREVCRSLRELPALVIAAIGGHALAGGLELAAACDLRFCSDDERTQLGVPEMDLFGAMPTGGGGVQFLARLLGPARALEFVLEAKPIAPTQALAYGLVQRLYPRDEVRPAAEEFARQVAAKAGRIGVAAAKRSIFVGADLSLAPALDLDQSVHWDAMRRGNFLPGVDSFVAKFGQSRS